MFQVTPRGELTEEPMVKANAASLEAKPNEGESLAKKYLVSGPPTGESFF